MESIVREQLKQEIDRLDGAYLALAYRVLHQFPHRTTGSQPEPHVVEKTPFSQRWRGRLRGRTLSAEELEADPRLAYLAGRYRL